MRVLMYAALPESGAGGVQAYLGALIKALGELTDGNEEYILLTLAGHDSWLRGLCGSNQRIETIKPVVQNTRKGLMSRLLDRILATREQIPERFPDRRSSPSADLTRVLPVSNGFIESFKASVIHFPFQWFIVSSLPSVFNPHDLQHLHLPQYFSPDVLLWREMLYPFACRVASRIAVASDWTSKDIQKHYSVTGEKIAVIPWGAATAAFPAPTAADLIGVRQRHKLPEQYLLYPAVAWPHKNHRRLIEAAAHLRNMGKTCFIVCSGAPTDLTPSLQQQVNKCGLAEFFRFLGHVPQEEMRALYSGANIVIIPTLFEAVSGPVAEAWQEGVPVACSNIPQLQEQAGDAAQYFDPTSASSIADTIEALINDNTKRNGLIRAGNRRLDLLQWRNTALKYRELYRETAEWAGTFTRD